MTTKYRYITINNVEYEEQYIIKAIYQYESKNRNRRIHYQKNREKIIEKQKESFINKPDRLIKKKEYLKKYYIKNREKLNEKRRERRKKQNQYKEED